MIVVSTHNLDVGAKVVRQRRKPIGAEDVVAIVRVVAGTSRWTRREGARPARTARCRSASRNPLETTTIDIAPCVERELFVAHSHRSQSQLQLTASPHQLGHSGYELRGDSAW